MKSTLFLCSLLAFFTSAMKRTRETNDDANEPSKRLCPTKPDEDLELERSFRRNINKIYEYLPAFQRDFERVRKNHNKATPDSLLSLKTFRTEMVQEQIDGLFMAPMLSVVEAVQQNSWPDFVAALSRGEVSGHQGKSLIYLCLAEAIDGGFASFFRRMMRDPRFREALGTDLLDMAAKNPDTLWVFAVTQFGKGEAEFLKEEPRVLKLIEDNFMKMKPSTRRLFLEKFKYNPEFGVKRVMILDPQNAVDQYDTVVGEIASRYFALNREMFPDVTDMQLTGVCLALIEAMRTQDIDALTRILKSRQTPRLDDFIQLVLDVGLSLQEHYLVDLVAGLGHTFKSFNLQNMFPILRNAVHSGLSEKVIEILSKCISAIIPQLQHQMNYHSAYHVPPPTRKIDDSLVSGFLDELVECGDLLTLSKIRASKMKIEPRHEDPIKLAEAAFSLNLPWVLHFMDLHPEKMILSDAAWDLILQPQTEILVNMIHSKNAIPNRYKL